MTAVSPSPPVVVTLDHSVPTLVMPSVRYRARFITGTVSALLAKDGGGEAWLHSLRQVPMSQAVEALSTLPGVGPKVAACVCLFSLDKHESIPVDTHVWQLAARHYLPQVAGKAPTPKLHGLVQGAFVRVFGPYAGWAHNTLFISELSSHRDLLPGIGRSAAAKGMAKAKAKGQGRGNSRASPSQTGGKRSAHHAGMEDAEDSMLSAKDNPPTGDGTMSSRRKSTRQRRPSVKATRNAGVDNCISA